MDDRFHIEVFCQQKNHEGERICGDVFVSRRIREENRTIAVLSDGMGHGVKANILATLTATMALNFTQEHKDAKKTAEIIMKTLPVCSERRMSYSTFTIVDMDEEGEVRILEYDNPKAVLMRGNKLLDPQWQYVVLETDNSAGKEIRLCHFYPRKEDRILFFSDGITQAGMGKESNPFGWGEDDLHHFIVKQVSENLAISAKQLAAKVVKQAYILDGYYSKDDTSCGVIYFREPRKLLICTGPPYEEDQDKAYGDAVRHYQGKKILCGATTADIVARELEQTIEDTFEFTDPDLPPISYMEGVDLITEGILTLSKVAEILKNYTPNTQLKNGPADRIVKYIFESDAIDFIIGTRINIAHQDPSLPVELEIRRTVVRRIARLLEEKFLKEVTMQYL